MKPKISHHKTISLVLQKLALRQLLNLSFTLSKLHKIKPFRSLVQLACSRRIAAGRSKHTLEYQFSVSSTPLIRFGKGLKQDSLRRFCTLLCPCICLKLESFRWDDEDSSVDIVTESSRILMLTSYEEYAANINYVARAPDPAPMAMLTSYEGAEDYKVAENWNYSGGYDDCVDEKAEIFIAKFYEDMRKQIRDSSS